ncbi:hypothetical protein K523DRAFT_356585 [Schizophyllum commune Tattone D]|nr:hypothetical protein K523DRAFT_356585 [Schizophyllum commune Tattone D]
MSSSALALHRGADEEDGSDSEPELPRTPKRRHHPNDPALATTPKLMTKGRPPAIKKKVEAMIGMRVCLLTGIRHKYTVITAHWLRRELAISHPAMFSRLQDKIGSIIKLDDGRLIRLLRLDSSDNQDQLGSDPHAAFDGFSLGEGQWCLIPIDWKVGLKRIRNNPHMSARQWFPERTWLYKVHVFAGEGPLTLTRRGPDIRPYGPQYISQEQLDKEELVLAAEACRPIFTLPSEDPNDVETMWRVDPDKNQPESGSWILRSHLNRANVYADAVIKLRYRWLKCKKEGKEMPEADADYYKRMWSDLQYWFQDVPPLCPADQIGMPVPDEVYNNRQTLAYYKSRTEPAIQTTAEVPVKPRPVAGSAPPVRVPSSGFLAQPDSPPPSPSPLRPLSPTLPMPPPPSPTQEARPAAVKRKRSDKEPPTAYSKPSRDDAPSEPEADSVPSKKKRRMALNY